MYNKLRTFLKKKLYPIPFFWKIVEILQGVLYVSDYFFCYKFFGHEKRFSIKEFNIEFASPCNLRCEFCSLDHTKPKQFITKEILETVLEKFIKDKRFRNIEVINLHNGGEILLHPKRIEMLSILKKYKSLAQKHNFRFPKVYMLTNGTLLKEKLSKQILELDVIDEIGMSIDGGTPEAYEEMRKNAVWPKVYENVKALKHLIKEGGRKVKMSSICCIPENKSLNIKWMHPEFKEILEMFDRYELRRLHNWGGEIETIKRTTQKKHKIGCTLLMRQLVLLPNGDITVCCNDLNSKGVIGNILKKDIFAIYKSKERMNYIKLLLYRQKSKLLLCKNCETF